MSEKEGLNEFDFNRVGSGRFLKFVAGEPVTIRILTKDPVVSETMFGDDISTRLNFVVWNWTAEKAQILSTSFNMGKTFKRIGTDEDFGANLQACDIKISAEGEKLKRVYDINVLRHSGGEKELTRLIVDELKKIDLLKDVKDNKGRLSEWEPEPTPLTDEAESGYDKAKRVRDDLDREDDIEGESINISDIPF